MTTVNHLMGVDIGAGSVKTTIISTDGRVVGDASMEIATRHPKPGWTEQDPDEWYSAMCATVPRALQKAGLCGADVAAISFSAGAHTPVLLDEADKPLRPAILWSDQRSGAEARHLSERHGGMILATGCNQPNPTWTLPQLAWLQKHEPHIGQKTRKLMVAKDYLRFRLTGEWHTDRTDAIGTLLYDASNDCWSREICDLINWRLDTLPPVVSPTAIIGTVGSRAAAETGLAVGTKVVCGTSDTSIESFGAGAVESGAGCVKLATAATVSVVAAAPTIHSTLINYPYAVPGLWYTIVATNSCASAHKWLRDSVFAATDDRAFAHYDRAAADIAAGSEGLLFHPYLNGERSPYWDPLLRADFIGLTMAHGQAHLTRALYEGIAYSLRDCLSALRAQGLDMSEARIVGGGSKSALWRRIVCDVLAMPISMPAVTDASFGAALLAGVGAGIFADEISAARACVEIAARHEPDPASAATYTEMFGIYKDAQSRLADINHRLHHVAVGGL